MKLLKSVILLLALAFVLAPFQGMAAEMGTYKKCMAGCSSGSMKCRDCCTQKYVNCAGKCTEQANKCFKNCDPLDTTCKSLCNSALNNCKSGCTSVQEWPMDCPDWHTPQ